MSQEFTLAELKALTGKKDLHMLIHGKVYAIAKFMDEHPGGDEVLLGEAGKDATEAFEDVGHSDEAREILDKYLVGTCAEAAPTGPPAKVARAAGQAKEAQSYTYLAPLAALVAYMAYKWYNKEA